MKKLSLSDIQENVRRLPAVQSVFQHIMDAYEEALDMMVRSLGADAGIRIIEVGI